MNSLSRITLLALLLAPNVGSAQRTIQLFNHKDLNGWYAFEPESGKHLNASELFKVEDHMIRLYGDKIGYLMSNESFSNFRLTVEFRWNMDSSFTKKTNNKNSGVMYLVPPEIPDELWPKGMQFQVKEGSTGDFILLQDVTIRVKGVTTEPGKSVVSPRFQDAWKPIGEWNTLTVTSVKGKIAHELNGKLVNEGVDPSVSTGRILLQYEGYPIDFRKIVIKKL